MEYLNWEDPRLGTWDSLTDNWEAVLIEEIVEQSVRSGMPIESVLQQLPPEKTKKLLKILVTVNGEEYVEQKYKNQNKIHISVSDFKQIATAYNIEVI